MDSNVVMYIVSKLYKSCILLYHVMYNYSANVMMQVCSCHNGIYSYQMLN